MQNDFFTSSKIVLHFFLKSVNLIFKVDYRKRPDLEVVITEITSVKNSFISDPSLLMAWETFNSRINIQGTSVDERTFGSRDIVKELSLMDFNAQNAPDITHGTGLHFQKMSNLCVYFATMSAVRHEMKKILENSTSMAVNINPRDGYPTKETLVPIPAGKSIDELFEAKEFRFMENREGKFQNALSFERMLSVFLCCVSPRPFSGKGQILKKGIIKGRHFSYFFNF